MILCTLPAFHRYTSLHPSFPLVEAFLANADIHTLAEGRIELQGDDVYVSSAPAARTRTAAEAHLEAHRTYIDVQVIMDGIDTMGWAPLESCCDLSIPYDAAKDIVFFRDEPGQYIPVQPGQLVIFFPEDAHAPLIGDGHTVRKLVVKVRAQP